MANLYMFSRSTPPIPFQSFSSPCSLRSTPSYASNRDQSCRSQESCAFAVDSIQLATKSWTQYPGHHCARKQRGFRISASLLESDVPSLITESMRFGSVGSFMTDAVVGRVECNNRGCRPIFDDDEGTCALHENIDGEKQFNLIEARTALHASRTTTRDLEIRPNTSFLLDFAEYVNEVWKDETVAAKYFGIAMMKNPKDGNVLLQYAQFAWKTLGDLEKADELFVHALELSPSDSDANAMYALFCWQTEE